MEAQIVARSSIKFLGIANHRSYCHDSKINTKTVMSKANYIEILPTNWLLSCSNLNSSMKKNLIFSFMLQEPCNGPQDEI